MIHVHVPTAMCVDMSIDTCADMCVDTRTGMCIDVYTHVCPLAIARGDCLQADRPIPLGCEQQVCV